MDRCINRLRHRNTTRYGPLTLVALPWSDSTPDLHAKTTANVISTLEEDPNAITTSARFFLVSCVLLTVYSITLQGTRWWVTLSGALFNEEVLKSIPFLCSARRPRTRSPSAYAPSPEDDDYCDDDASNGPNSDVRVSNNGWCAGVTLSKSALSCPSPIWTIAV